jgi:hypothetical protein
LCCGTLMQHGACCRIVPTSRKRISRASPRAVPHSTNLLQINLQSLSIAHSFLRVYAVPAVSSVLRTEMARDPYRTRVCRRTRAGAVQNLNDRQCAGITQFMFSIHAWRKSRSTLGASTYDQPPHSHRAKNLKTCAQIILSLRERRK